MPKKIVGSPDGAAKAAARQEVFDALHEEMAFADYSRGKTGQKVKKVPRNQLPAREAKRKAMEEADMMEMAIEADDDYEGGEDAGGGGEVKKKRKRLRGSKVAFDDVVLNSMPLASTNVKKRGVTNSSQKEPPEDEEDEDSVQDPNERYEMLQEVAVLGIDLDPDEVGKIDDFEDEDEVEDDESGDDDEEKDDSGDGGDESGEEDQEDANEECKTAPKKKGGRGKARGGGKVSVNKNGLVKPKASSTKRVMHRLRDFTSQRLADKHGEALGAHIRGMSETAVQKLREVAKMAPGAPQVYSSLGMVFESMLTDLEEGDNEDYQDEDVGGSKRYALLERRLELAQKAYASYHVAALLCKRDFVLWERSGDAALKVQQIYSDLIDHVAKFPSSGVTKVTVSTKDATTRKGFDPNATAETWRSDLKLWMEHALSAYQSSDNLRPTGVDIPCKLAEVHMSLGHHIDALSILTDLRSRASGENGQDNSELKRSDMEGSYPCWLLYADLMVKIGYECKQWKEGTSTNDNFMFKRWLRKNAAGFDWRERRLQALCLALEAAAGTKSCTKLVKWMRERAKKYLDNKEKEVAVVENITDDNKSNEEGAKENNDAAVKDTEAKEHDGIANKDVSGSRKAKYEEERERLLNRNKVEIQKFDRMTGEMNLVAGSHISKNRIAARAALVKKQRASIKDLAMKRFAEEHEESANENEEPTGGDDLSENELSPKPLPPQGSYSTVYDIAVLLLRQCIQLRLFDGGLLTVQSVLEYSNERVARHGRKMEAQRRQNDLLQSAGQGLLQPGFKFDQINCESEDSDEEGGLGTFISDDEDLEKPGVLQSLERGRLPMDIRAMHAICLLGAGGQDHMALNYVEQVILSNELDLFGSDADTNNRDVSISGDPGWVSFSDYFNAPINKSSLLAAIADLTEHAKDNTRSHRVLRIFRKHLNGIESNHGKNQGLAEAMTSSKESDRVHTLKILISSLKLMVFCAKRNLTQPGKEFKTVEKAVNDSILALMMILRFQHILWKPCYSEWSLPQPSIDMLSILAGAASVLVRAANSSEDSSLQGTIQVGSMKARHLISTICHADSAPPKTSVYSDVRTWKSFPLSSSWQNSFHEKISLRAYNLCVACCVTSFSGWEPCEFNLDQLRSSDADVNFFGVSLEGPCVGGLLPKNVASAVAEQWEYMQGVLPDLEGLSFDLHLDERKKTEWCQKVIKNIPPIVTSYGEEDGIKALLSFSTLCLMAAEASKGDEKDEFVKLSMSVLLPMTQFSIDKQCWSSSIGAAAISRRNETKVGYYLDEQCHWMGPTKSKEGRMQSYINKTQARLPRPAKEVTRPVRRRRRQFTNVIKVPISALANQWAKVVLVERRDSLEDAQLAMKKVDWTMKNLRKSRTLNALERASIDVSVALLAMASYDECKNPFVCLQQAAMFAAMGSKRGNNDEAFKQFLPLRDKCLPLEALNILGRADSLRAIHFLHEAQFLCTWVASVCRSHRDQVGEDLTWNSRWMVVGIVTYVVSATIDETGEALSQENPNAGALRKWDDPAKEEFSRGKADVLALVDANPVQRQRANSTDAPADDEETPLMEDDEIRVPLLPNQSEINGLNYQFGQHVQRNVVHGEQHYFEGGLQEAEIDIGAPEDGDEYDPFAGVEAVGI